MIRSMLTVVSLLLILVASTAWAQSQQGETPAQRAKALYTQKQSVLGHEKLAALNEKYAMVQKACQVRQHADRTAFAKDTVQEKSACLGGKAPCDHRGMYKRAQRIDGRTKMCCPKYEKLQQQP